MTWIRSPRKILGRKGNNVIEIWREMTKWRSLMLMITKAFVKVNGQLKCTTA
jgi:hypothetical protein